MTGQAQQSAPFHPNKSIFDQNLRVLICERCAAPVQSTVAGGQIQCSYCGALNILTSRDDRGDYQAAHHQPRMSEGQRYQILRGQQERVLMPPASLASLVVAGQMPARNEPMALQQWNAAR